MAKVMATLPPCATLNLRSVSRAREKTDFMLIVATTIEFIVRTNS